MQGDLLRLERLRFQFAGAIVQPKARQRLALRVDGAFRRSRVGTCGSRRALEFLGRCGSLFEFGAELLQVGRVGVDLDSELNVSVCAGCHAAP